MASSVISSFKEFLSEKVNLDPDEAKTAISSKDWLIGQISSISELNENFPTLAPEFNLHYGSFSRKTKTRILDDIDIMIGIGALGSTYNLYSPTHATIYANTSVPNLIALCNQGTNELNSIKVINYFVSHLKEIHQYRKAEIKRNNVAAVLNLTSYDWSFDIVPCFRTNEDAFGKNSYFIPDGNGNWQLTDPRIDQARITTVNQKHNGKVLNAIRIMKFWNKRRVVKTIPSYLLENIILNYYEGAYGASEFVDIEVPYLLDYISDAILLAVPDPKGMQGDINTLTMNERNAIRSTAMNHANAAKKAREYEKAKNEHMSVLYWYDVFGDEFPRWG